MASFIETTKNTYLFGLLTLFVTIYGPRLSPKLPEPVQKAFSHPIFRGVVMFLVVFMAKHDIRTSIVVTVIFLILSHILQQENLTETFIQKYERNIENFTDANSIHGTVCAMVEKNQHGSNNPNPNKAYYDRQCYGKPGIPLSVVQDKCVSLDQCPEEHCWRPTRTDDVWRYDLQHYKAEDDDDTSRSFQCTTPSDTNTADTCKPIDPFKTSAAICSYDKKNGLALSDGSNNVGNTTCSHNLQCEPIKFLGSNDVAPGSGYMPCPNTSPGQYAKCVKSNNDQTIGKCINIPCTNYKNYKDLVGTQAGLKTVDQKKWQQYCDKVNKGTLDGNENLDNSILNPIEIPTKFDQHHSFTEGEINDSTWPYLFINRQESPGKFEDVPERAAAQRTLYQDANSSSNGTVGLGCWREVYDLNTKQQIERGIAAPTTDDMIYNPQSSQVKTGFGLMTDSVRADISKFA